eukprot:gene19-394_t
MVRNLAAVACLGLQGSASALQAKTNGYFDYFDWGSLSSVNSLSNSYYGLGSLESLGLNVYTALQVERMEKQEETRALETPTSGKFPWLRYGVAMPQVMLGSDYKPPIDPKGIHILVPATGNFAAVYKWDIDSMRCYAARHGYTFVTDLTGKDGQLGVDKKCGCKNNDFFFRKHCMTACYLESHPEAKYVVVLDADVMAGNPAEPLDHWIGGRHGKKDTDISFYARCTQIEIAAGNYIAKNTKKSIEFLREWSSYEDKRPPGFSSSDNGALHAVLVAYLGLSGRPFHETRIAKDFSHAKFASSNCLSKYSKLTKLTPHYEDYFDFVQSCRHELRMGRQAKSMRTWLIDNDEPYHAPGEDRGPRSDDFEAFIQEADGMDLHGQGVNKDFSATIYPPSRFVVHDFVCGSPKYTVIKKGAPIFYHGIKDAHVVGGYWNITEPRSATGGLAPKCEFHGTGVEPIAWARGKCINQQRYGEVDFDCVEEFNTGRKKLRGKNGVNLESGNLLFKSCGALAVPDELLDKKTVADVGVVRSQFERGLLPDPQAPEGKNCMLDGTVAGQVLKKIERAEAPAANKKTRILCMVHTTESSHETRIRAIKETWGKQCDGFLAFSTASDASIPSVNIHVPGEKGKQTTWPRTRISALYASKNYLDKFDFFLTAEDDAFFFIPNLKKYLSSDEIQKSKDGLFLGHKFFNIDGQGLDYNSGGAGHVMDRVALKRMVSNLNEPECCPGDHPFEDVHTSKCLANIGINPHDTRDELQQHRFHPQPPEQRFAFNMSSATGWDREHDPEQQEGLDCCSKNSVSFYSMSPEATRNAFIYHNSC